MMMSRRSGLVFVQLLLAVQVLFQHAPLAGSRSLAPNANLEGEMAYPNYYDVSTRASLGVILPVLLFVFLVGTVIGTCIFETFFEQGHISSTKPEVQSNMILCHDENAEFEYKLVLRVGCPTANFDMKNGYIDVVVLGPDDQPQGSPTRFKCARIPDKVCGECHLELIRMTPMPPIAGIMLNHSDRFGTIFLYETILIDLIENTVIETRRFNTYLTSTPTIYRGRKCSIDDADDGLYPELPLLEWTKLECAILATFLVMVIGSIALIIEHFNMYPTNQDQDGSMVRSLINVIFVLPFALVLLAGITIFYKFYFKRNVTMQEYAVSEASSLSWSFLCKVYLGFLLIIALIMFAVFVYFGLSISLIKSVYWWCSTLLTSVIIFGIWAIANKSLSFQSLLEGFRTTKSQEMNLPAHSPLVVPGSTAADHESNQMTVFFMKNTSSKPLKSTGKVISTCLGPPLTNPKLKVKGNVNRAKISGKKKKKAHPFPRVRLKSSASTNSKQTRQTQCSQNSRHSKHSKNSKNMGHTKKNVPKKRHSKKKRARSSAKRRANKKEQQLGKQ